MMSLARSESLTVTINEQISVETPPTVALERVKLNGAGFTAVNTVTLSGAGDGRMAAELFRLLFLDPDERPRMRLVGNSEQF